MEPAVIAGTESYLVTGPVFFPVAYEAILRDGWHQFDAVRTARDVRQLPWPFDRFTSVVDDPETYLEDLVEAGDLGGPAPDDLVLPETWADSILSADDGYPWQPPLPWEITDSPFAYDRWMPREVLERVEAGDLTSPMQETARWSFPEGSYAEIVALFCEIGWEVAEEPERIDRVVGQY